MTLGELKLILNTTLKDYPDDTPVVLSSFNHDAAMSLDLIEAEVTTDRVPVLVLRTDDDETYGLLPIKWEPRVPQ